MDDDRVNSPDNAAENPYINLSPVEANGVLSEIFEIVPLRRPDDYSAVGTTQHERDWNDKLYAGAVDKLTTLLGVSGLTTSGQEALVEEFKSDYSAGLMDESAIKYLKKRGEELHFSDPAGGIFGGKAHEVDDILYERFLSASAEKNLKAKSSVRRIIEKMQPLTNRLTKFKDEDMSIDEAKIQKWDKEREQKWPKETKRDLQ